jgi:hypothetical protein|tara:strand:- start:14050 stop:14268 length:219 start_codon:yes stop_codon:yes gene_type:complete
MSSDKIIDALHTGSNLDAEDAFKDAMKDKIAMAIDNKKQEVAKGFVRDHITEVEPEAPVAQDAVEPEVTEKE